MKSAIEEEIRQLRRLSRGICDVSEVVVKQAFSASEVFEAYIQPNM